MKRFVSSLLLTSLLWGAADCPYLPSMPAAQAQVPTSSDDLYYYFYNQRIPLNLQANQIAVAFKPAAANTRDPGDLPYLQLQRALQGEPSSNTRGTRSAPTTPLNVQVQPLGSQYALIEFTDNTRSTRAAVQERLQQPYVETTLPVLTRPDSDDTILLPNEIVLSLEPNLSESQKQLLLVRYDLEIVRPLRFSRDRYLVRSKTATGTDVLAVANQLNAAVGIQSATPNFVQSIPYRTVTDLREMVAADVPDAQGLLDTLLATLPPVQDSPFLSNLLPLQWHLDSTPQRGQLLPRTDIQAVEAWQNSNDGEGAVVAVIDSLIQWDHPDLAANVYAVDEGSETLPGEVHGWDFSNPQVSCDAADICVAGDPDTRISPAELAILRPHFQNTFQLSDAELLQEYESLAQRIAQSNPDLAQPQIARILRNWLRGQIAAEFHGTWSAGVIGAQATDEMGVMGVAPKAQILPIRVFGLGGEISSAALIEAVGYAAERDVDVINMSLGGLLPDRELTDQIFAILDQHPDLVIIASAGNDNLDGVAFPAAIPGVVSVGATNLSGNRTGYSSYGASLDLVAPGGETALTRSGGILTTGGTWVPGFWQGLTPPDYAWGVALDPAGEYVQVQGTSFSAPTVSGVVALMKGENPELARERVIEILQATASYEGLQMTQADANRYRLQAEVGFGTALNFPVLRPSGIFTPAEPVSAEQYFFGSGLVNAAAAVEAAKR